MDKASWKAKQIQDKNDIRKKKRLLREKNEAKLCGNYDLVYPIVSYAEEDMIRDRIALENPNYRPKQDKGINDVDSEEDETYRETESRVLDLL
jgi:hypothetical protein